jgi:FdhE protein
LKGRGVSQARIARAEELAERFQPAKEVLAFYIRVLEFQSGVGEGLQPAIPALQSGRCDFRGALDLETPIRDLRHLALLVAEHGPVKLAADAEQWRQLTSSEVHARLSSWLAAQDDRDRGPQFFPRVLLEPQAERIASSLDPRPPAKFGNRCPVCNSAPQLAVLRPEGDGGKRALLCSFCHTDWEFRRILCPACGEENHEKLPRYSADGIAAVRVEACDTCCSYLKSVDLTIDGRAVPLVDEVATASLDLWAAEHDYLKICPNVMGF